MNHRGSNVSNVSLDNDRFMRSNSKLGQTDPFTEYLEDQVPNLMPYKVLPPNKSGLDAKYQYAAISSFPTLDDKYMIKPRRVDLQNLNGSQEEEKESKLLRKPSKRVQFTDSDDHRPPHIGRTRRQRSLNKNQTPLDRAKFQMLQVYGTWFAAHVAALDFKDIPGDEVAGVVDGTLNVLYGMTGESVPEELRVVPDELIYKVCCQFLIG